MNYQEAYGEMQKDLTEPQKFEKMLCDHLGTSDIHVFAGNGCDFDFEPSGPEETNGSEILRDHLVGDEIRFSGNHDGDGWIYGCSPTPRTAILRLGKYKNLPFAIETFPDMYSSYESLVVREIDVGEFLAMFPGLANIGD